LNLGKPSNFEDESFANQVNYHEKELRRILKGTSAKKKFLASQNVIGSCDTVCSPEKGVESMFVGWSLNGHKASLRYKC
jgi:hypothetical protein